MKQYIIPDFSASRLAKDLFWASVLMGVCVGSLGLFGAVKFWKWGRMWAGEFFGERELP